MLALALLVRPCVAFLTDTGTHAPPTSGTYAYETWTPANPAFPDVDASYVDPVFSEEIWRVTDIYPGTGTSGSGIIYGINGLWNADMSAYFHDSPGGVDLIDPRNGSLTRANVPYPYTTTDAISFDPVNPAIYYYTNGTQ